MIIELKVYNQIIEANVENKGESRKTIEVYGQDVRIEKWDENFLMAVCFAFNGAYLVPPGARRN